MADTTPRLALPELVASQAQKHVTHNEALIMLDCLVDLYLTSMALAVPPASPLDGDAYVVASGGSGEWAGADGKIAYCIDGAWRIYAPCKGLRAFNADDSTPYIFTAGGWIKFAATLDVAGSVLAPGKLLIGSTAGKAAAVALSGDATVSSSGAVTVSKIGGKSAVMPADGTIVDLASVQTLANKTFSGSTYFPSGVISSGGSIGVGTSSPSAKLHVVSANGEGLPTIYVGGPLFQSNNADYTCAMTILGSRTGGSTIYFGDSDSQLVGRLTYNHTADAFDMRANTSVVVLNAGATSIAPGGDNTQSCGSASKRFSVVYAATGAINTSWSREKTNVRALTDSEVACFLALAGNACVYQWIDAVRDKGAEAARLHVGFIADDTVTFDAVASVQAICKAHGVDPECWGFFCKDVLKRQVARVCKALSPDGDEVVEEYLEDVDDLDADGNAQYRYGLRYGELREAIAAAEHAALMETRAALAALEARIAALEAV